MKDTAHEHFAADDLIEQDVPVKGTQDDEKPPRREPRIPARKTAFGEIPSVHPDGRRTTVKTPQI